MKNTLEKLTKQEEEAMLAIWQTGRGAARDFLEKHAQPAPHYNTFVSTIKNLEKKGYVSHRQIGNVNEYYPLVKEEDYKKQFLTTVVKNHFSNSYKELVAFFADEKKISAEDLQEIMDMIERKKK